MVNHNLKHNVMTLDIIQSMDEIESQQYTNYYDDIIQELKNAKVSDLLELV